MDLTNIKFILSEKYILSKLIKMSKSKFNLYSISSDSLLAHVHLLFEKLEQMYAADIAEHSCRAKDVVPLVLSDDVCLHINFDA